jgi:trimethylamine:corrinoid methyltransferase-like protein
MPTVVERSSRFRGAGNVVFTTVSGAPALLDLSRQEYRVLNETAVRIWQLVQIESSVGEMARTLSEEYDIGEDEAREAVTSLCDRLLREGLVEWIRE